MSERNEKAKADFINMPFWKALFGFGLSIFGAWELYHWYSTGAVNICGWSGKCIDVIHQNSPRAFDFYVTVYVGGFLLFGFSSIAWVYYRIKRMK